MRTTILLASLILLATIASAATADDSSQAPRIQTGQEAPAISLADTDEDLHTLKDLRGEKDVILIFFRGSW